MAKNKKTIRFLPSPSDGAGESGPINTDPLGSYTGLPTIEAEVPVQDADDL